MIKNERQYRITKAQAENFSKTLRHLEGSSPSTGVHPLLHKAQIDALRGQLRALQAEVEEYDYLRSGQKKAIDIESLDDVPKALIQARIAAGMTQEDLAEKLGLKHQQVQRYEATDYSSASLDRVGEVARALGVEATGKIDMAMGDTSIRTMLRRLKGMGLDEDFVSRRLLPSPARNIAEKKESLQLEAAEAIERVFGWDPTTLFGAGPLSLVSTASSSARFKLPAKAKCDRLSAYVVYAHYLALLVLEATVDVPRQPLPTNAKHFRAGVLTGFGSVSFENVIRYIWQLGVPILPLNDAGAFHGACWRVGGRNIIVLRQRTPAPNRWLHDLLHEFWHSANKPDLEEHPLIEEDELSPVRRQSEEEMDASQFAGDVMLDARAEELAAICVDKSKGSVERLKSVVPDVARNNGVSPDALANYLAFRLSLQGLNWWGAATNLQEPATDFETTPRELLLAHLNLELLPDVDKRLLLRALEPIVIGLSGRSGSGKTEVSKAIAHDLGWQRASFGDYVRTVARSEGLDPSDILVLQDLGEKLISQGAEQFCRSVLTHFNWKSGEPLVVDGVRHEEVVTALRRLVAPLDFRLVHLDVDDKTRKARLLNRGTEARYVTEIEDHPTEQQTTTTLPGKASLRLAGGQPLQDVVRQIVTWVHEGDGELVA